MEYLAEDPLHNAIHHGIKGDINCVFENQRYRAGVILIYSGIDAMAFLGMPANQFDVSGSDFIEWVERYIRFPGTEQLTGIDLYGARCAMLHSYGVKSKASRQGKCRMVAYMDRCHLPVIYSPSVSQDLVLVSIYALRDAFFGGIDSFLVDLFSDPERARTAENRLQQFTVVTRRH